MTGFSAKRLRAATPSLVRAHGIGMRPAPAEPGKRPHLRRRSDRAAADPPELPQRPRGPTGRCDEHPARTPAYGDEGHGAPSARRAFPRCLDHVRQDLARAAGDISTTIFHPVSTARMGTDPGAVVAPDLTVHGIGGLRRMTGFGAYRPPGRCHAPSSRHAGRAPGTATLVGNDCNTVSPGSARAYHAPCRCPGD
jgi:hypothetical protein